MLANKLWFDVGIKRYTTSMSRLTRIFLLWFDVGIKRYTTEPQTDETAQELWFDVGIKRYTTSCVSYRHRYSCGLM